MKACRHWPIWWLLVAHVLFGITAAWLGTLGRWAAFYDIVFAAIVGAQAVLLGSWAGLSSRPLGSRVAGLACGCCFVAGVIAVATNMPLRSGDLLILAGVVTSTAAVVGLLFVALRRYRGVEVVRLCQLDDDSAKALRFGVWHLLVGTALMSALLGCGHVIRSLGGESLGIGVLALTFIGCGCIMAMLAAWASLAAGSPLLRIPITLAIASLVGLFPPFFLGGPWWRYLTWPGLLATTGTIAMLSMLVVRYCGYRLVCDKA